MDFDKFWENLNLDYSPLTLFAIHLQTDEIVILIMKGKKEKDFSLGK